MLKSNLSNALFFFGAVYVRTRSLDVHGRFCATLEEVKLQNPNTSKMIFGNSNVPQATWINGRVDAPHTPLACNVCEIISYLKFILTGMFS